MTVQGLSFTVGTTNEGRLGDGKSNSIIMLGEIMEVTHDT